jgi:hypothetical protein
MTNKNLLIYTGAAALLLYFLNKGIGATSSQAKAATAIKQELKKAFPNTKFSVKSDSFSGGDSVRINWIDGPTTEMVDNIVSKYQYGSFNGMIDMYEYDNSNPDIPQTKYVQTSRSMKKSTAEVIKQHILDTYSGIVTDNNGNFEDIYQNNWAAYGAALIYREFNKQDLSKLKS